MLKGVNCFHKGNCSFEDCLKCSETYDNPCLHSPAIIQGIKENNEGESRRNKITGSMLSSCPRKMFLCQEYDYYETIDKLYWSFRGKIAHQIAENYENKDCIKEKRYHTYT